MYKNSMKLDIRLPIVAFTIALQAIPVLASTNLDKAPAELKGARSSLHSFKPKELPAEPARNHDANSVLDLGPLQQSMMIQVSSTRPIRLEASFNEPLTLEHALRHAIDYSLPIRIARESWTYQRWQFYGQLADFLPSYSTSWNLTNSWIHSSGNSSNARVYTDRMSYPLFTGGNTVYTALAQYYRERGWRQSFLTSINDALLSVYQNYINLRLNNALLQIRSKSLEVSEAQLKVNNALYTAGTGTQFAIMQSRTQLAADQQALLQQQVATRLAALVLAYSMNAPLGVNLIPVEQSLSESKIIDETIGVDDLIGLALSHRPELRQYELFQIAAARNVQVAASPLYPVVGLFNAYTHASTSTYKSSAQKEEALIARNATFSQIIQAANKASSSSSSGSGSGSGSSGSGSSSSSSSSSGSASSTSSSSSSSSNASAGVFGGLTNTWQQGFSMSWSLPNLGLGNVCNIYSARALSRQAMLQANQELLLVDQQVRTAYLNAVTAKAQIDATAYGVASAREALRLAMLRLQTGVGTNLELIQAQRDFITALTSQAQAIAASNLAQAQLLHDSGLISYDTLVRSYHPGAPFTVPKKVRP